MGEPPTQDDRRKAGVDVIRTMFGRYLGDDQPPIAATPDGPAGDLSRLAVEHCYGEIWSRPGLDLRSRSLVTLGILIASGHPDELRNHIKGALGNGLTPDEVLEAMLHSVAYVGFPAAGKAMAVAIKTLDALKT